MPSFKVAFTILAGLSLFELHVIFLDDMRQYELVTSAETQHDHAHVSRSTGICFSGEKIKSFDSRISIISALESSVLNDYNLFQRKSTCKYN